MKTILDSKLSPRARRRLRLAAWVFLGYSIFGFLILPIIVKAIAVKQLARQFDREVTIQKVRINPMVLSGTIRGLLIRDKDGQPFVSWDEAYANFQLTSFLGKSWVFKEVRLIKPFARVQINSDRSLNFSDLIEKFSQPAPEPAKPAKPLYLRVSRLQVSGATGSFTDLTPSTPFRRVIGPLEITLTRFHTDPSNKNPYSFAGTTDSGEKFAWSGHFFLNPVRSEGELSLEGLSLPKYAPLYQDLVRFEFKDGMVDMRSHYRFGIGETNYVAAVSNAMFSLKSLKVAPKDTEETLAELDELKVSGVTADLAARTADVGSFIVSGGALALKRDQEEKINAIELARPADAATNAPGGVLLLLQAATNAFAALLQSTNLAAITVRHVDVTNCAVVWEDLVNRRPVRLPVDQIAVTARDLSNVAGSNMTAAVSLRWNTNGAIRVETEAQISPPSADIKLELTDLELGPLDPYLEPFVNLFITGSKVGLDGTIRMRSAANELPDVTFNGDLRLDDFATVDGVMTEEFVKWKSVRFSGVEAKLIPPEVAVKEIAVIEPRARVAVETNRIINVLAALKLGDTNAPEPAGETKPATAPAASRGKPGLGQKFGGLIRETLTSHTNAADSLAPKIAVGSVVISNATLEFNDRSLQPKVNVTLNELNGTITGISSEELKRADVQLSAKVANTGPVEIAGKINPLNHQAATQLKIGVHDVELSPAGPYVGKYAGYRLSRGKVNLELDYEISEGKLKARNLIVLDQFTLGEKVDSPDATKLPVRLAVAVLKDRSGRIELDVPVEGSLDDPEFRLGKVITRALVNVITKIVTSPFAALGSIFGGKGEELSFQDFAPGSAELQPGGTEKLDALTKGLYERPGLQVEIEGSIDPMTDRDGIARLKLEKELKTRKWNGMRKSEQARIKPEDIAFTPEEFDDYVKRTYAANFTQEAIAARTNRTGRSSAVPFAAATRTAEVEKAAPTLMAGKQRAPDLPPEEMRQQLFAFIEVTDDDFRQLASRRAARVKDYLMEAGKVEGERLFFTETPQGPVAAKGSRAYLHLR